MAAKRKCPRWLNHYMKFTENTESPDSYHRWAGISLVAGVLRRKVFMVREQIIYPNMYNVLIGPSGLSRKGLPIQMAKEFLERVNIELIGASNSKESMAMDLADSYRQFTDNTTGTIRHMCAATCVSEELAVTLGSQDTGLISYLTEWYDSRDTWKRSTKHQGIDEINGVCLNFLSAADPTWLPTILPREAVRGGLMSRILFIVEDRKKRSIPNPAIYPRDERLRDELTVDLEIMMTLTGQYRFDAEAEVIYEKWYSEQDGLLMAGKHPLQEMSGYLSRRGTHICKICMVLAACRSNSPIIIGEDVSTAISYLTALEPKMPDVYSGMVSTKYGKEINMVLKLLGKHGSAHKAEILNVLSSHIDLEMLEAIVKNLVARKLVQEVILPGNDIVLRLIDPDR